jgi:colanic acid/amylovoran biosynthesis glycosyltransferase
MKRVVHVVSHYPRLSQTFVSNEVAELRRQGVRVDVVSLFPGDEGLPRDGIVLSERFEAFDERRGALRRFRLRHPLRYRRFRQAVASVPSEVGGYQTQIEWMKLPALAEELRRDLPAVLHAHFAWNAAAAAMCLSKLLGVPWTVTLHANDIFSKVRNLDVKLRDADALVTVCEYNRRWLEREHGLDRPVTMVVCGVEVPAAAARTPTVDVVAVGRLVEKKGFDVLVDAAAILRATRPGLRVEILGEGPLRDDLDAQIRRLGLEDSVALVGARSHAETLALIASARVFCLPCRVAADGDRDSMPVVIKEAMARAVPVVATNEVAVPEMVDDTCGVLVAPDDPAALAAALDAVLADPARAAAMGEAGRRRVEEHFTLSGEVRKLAALFASMGAA